MRITAIALVLCGLTSLAAYVAGEIYDAGRKAERRECPRAAANQPLVASEQRPDGTVYCVYLAGSIYGSTTRRVKLSHPPTTEEKR